MIKINLAEYKAEMALELRAILTYWAELTRDVDYGGFYGRLDERDQIDPQAPKGIVLNSRILWAFSAAYTGRGREQYLGHGPKSV